MDAVLPAGGRARPPWLQSAAALLGIAVLVLLSIIVGVRYWWARDEALAIITVGAELVAFAGLGVAHWQWSRSRRLAFGAFIVTAIAASWCGFTMFQNIAAESREEALRVAQERPQYVFAANAAETAERLLTNRLRFPNPRPTCACPQTIAAWEVSEGAAIERLRNERDTAVRQMEAATPAPTLDVLALARGIGVELAKLFGFVVFVLALGPPRRKRGRSDVVEPVADQPPWRPTVVEGGLSTSQPASAQPAQPTRRWGLFAGLAAWLALLGQQPPAEAAAVPAITTNQPSPPTKPALELVVPANQGDPLSTIANKLSAQKWSERKIASELRVTRYQVRVWLGREKQAA